LEKVAWLRVIEKAAVVLPLLCVEEGEVLDDLAGVLFYLFTTHTV
jgi:hypothetical protein